MKKLLFILALLACIPSQAKPKTQNGEFTMKVGSYNVCTSDSRAKKIRKGEFKTPQRYYCNSAVAIARMIASIDCDIIGLEEVCDSMWAQSGNIDLRKLVASERGDDDYDWILYPNTSNHKISYDSAIGYKKSRFKKLESGIFWMTEMPDVPKYVPGAPKGSTRPAVWAKFKELSTGTVFFFYATHLVLGSMHNDGGNEYNATHFMKVAQGDFQEKYPSVVVGDFNCGEGSEAYRIMTSGRWKDCFDTLVAAGVPLSEETITYGTFPKAEEDGYWTSRIDHIMTWKFVPTYFDIIRTKFPTADGTLHHPSDHHPIVAYLTYKH